MRLAWQHILYPQSTNHNCDSTHIIYKIATSMINILNLIKLSLEKINLQCNFNRYSDPQTMQKKLITKDRPVIFDVGAHLGVTYTKYRKFFPRAEIHLVEPFAASAERLRSQTKNDPCSYLHQIALSNHDGERTLHVNAASSTNSLSSLRMSASSTWNSNKLKQVGKITVDVLTLDRLCKEIDIKFIDILKIDVQGAELSVLQGAKNLLENQRIGLLQFEFIVVDTYENQDPFSEYLALLESYNYQLIDIYQPLRRNGQLLQFDLLFSSSFSAPDPNSK